MIKQNKQNLYILTFSTCFLLMILFLLPEIILNKGTFFYYGDFASQQIPFMMHLHETIKLGMGHWDWFTELGADLQNSYGFYMLYSPFFWITLPFPTNWIPYLVAPIYALKIGLSGLFAFICFKYFLKEEKNAFIGAILYAFCGWQFSALFFNHFAEPFLMFPLLLFSFEKCYKERKWMLFVLMVFISIITNYFFFFGQVIFICLYFIFRNLFDNEYKTYCKNIFLIIISGFVGLLLSAFMLYPTIDYILSFNRVSNTISTNVWFFFPDIWHYLQIFKSFFIIPNYTGTEGLFDLTFKWANISLFIPIINNVFLLIFLRKEQKEQKWLKIFICSLFFIAFIPILNSIFSLFNSQYYARWFYMFTFFNILASLYVLKDYKLYIKEIKENNLLVYIISLIIVLTSVVVHFYNNTLKTMENSDFIQLIISFVIILLTYKTIKLLFLKNASTAKQIKYSILILIFIYLPYVFLSSFLYSSTEAYKNMLSLRTDLKTNIINLNTDFYRVSNSVNDYANIGLYINKPSTQIFLSSVESKSESFYSFLGKRNVDSLIELSDIGKQSILSTKYIYTSFTTEQIKELVEFDEYNQIDSQNGINILRNPYFIPFGFTYNNYITKEDYLKLTNKEQDIAVTKVIVINKKDEKFISQYINKYEQNNYGNIKENSETLVQNAVSNLIIDKDMFSCNINNFNNSVLFFSIPNSKHWSIYINDKQVETIDAFNGLVAIPLNEGEYKINGVYHNKFITTGYDISCIGIIAFIWMIILNNKKKKRID